MFAQPDAVKGVMECATVAGGRLDSLALVASGDTERIQGSKTAAKPRMARMGADNGQERIWNSGTQEERTVGRRQERQRNECDPQITQMTQIECGTGAPRATWRVSRQQELRKTTTATTSEPPSAPRTPRTACKLSRKPGSQEGRRATELTAEDAENDANRGEGKGTAAWRG